MKHFLLSILIAASAFAQTGINGRYIVTSDTVKWGGTVDSSSSIMGRGNVISRDSAGTWVAITTDSCSKWVIVNKLGRRATDYYELRYQVRTSSGNTDSSAIRIRFDNRICQDDQLRVKCDSIVHAGDNSGFSNGVTSLDTLTTALYAGGVTWRARSQTFFVPGGTQFRVCVDNVSMGGQANDSTFYRKFILNGY